MNITKAVVATILGSTLLFGCSSKQGQQQEVESVTTRVDQSNEQLAQMTFEEREFDFGEIKQGDVVEHVFTFTNSGEVPLKIMNVRTTCGCTAPEWPKEEIMPGASADLKVVFNSKGKRGNQSKNITIQANVPNSIEQVRILANVLTEEKQEVPM
ncbi:DUF1573 domain-containing protein [Algivirga pacifica]|uniref:DUF1573 domain-containing protein n=1 Tax=Algivirga pacifica TaxID=1162670 RepID=A0ABP9D5D7_9BACT